VIRLGSRREAVKRLLVRTRAEIKRRAEEKMVKLSETETSLNNLHKDGSLSEYWEDEKKREIIEDKRLIDYILKGETK